MLSVAYPADKNTCKNTGAKKTLNYDVNKVTDVYESDCLLGMGENAYVAAKQNLSF
jgi:hypothetical protein